MKLGLGKMQMRQEDFWSQSFQEWYSRIEGFAEFNGGGQPPPLDKSELENLMELYPDDS